MPPMAKNNKMIDNCQHGQSQLKNSADVSSTSNSYTAKKGNSFNLPPRNVRDDGHYYECVICDNGGDLLCCDTCPCTYHLQCLNPPLESIPSGNWQCENCSQDADLLTPLRSLRSLKENASSSKNAVNHIGEQIGTQRVKEFKVYRRHARKKGGEKEEDDGLRKLTVVCGPESANENQKDKPPMDTSGLFNCSSIEPESAEQANEVMEAKDASRQPKESNQKPVEEQGRAMVYQAMNSSVCAQSPNANQYDDLWFLRNVVQKSIEGHYFMQARREMQQILHPKFTQSSRAKKEKFARLRARQKQKIALRNSSRGLIPSSGLDGRAPLHFHMESAIDLKEPILQKPLLMKEKKALIDQLHSKASDQKYTHLNGFRNLSSTVDPRRLQYRQINSGRLPCFSSYQASDARFSEINLNHQEIGNGDVTLQELDLRAEPQGGQLHPRSSASNLWSVLQPSKNFDSMILKMSSFNSNYISKDHGMVDVWLEEELDSLWMGIRRYGQGNWEVMLRDPSLTFSKHKTIDDLSRRWNKEKLKIINPGNGSTILPSSVFRDSTDQRKNYFQVPDTTLPLLKDRLPSSWGRKVQENLLVGGLINIPKFKIDSEASEDSIQTHHHEGKELSSEGTISD
ncbi:hypothetical protein MANES_14G007252v8 [Manihot esculenta]|uniref:Uncharacterized protein n=1 Tax=Manihot esculenta TaxID=3983 RepID=A0A2C9UIK7_MANES|nr:hypothetical protein MANES_14G007252v8 [Manihot esculenta]